MSRVSFRKEALADLQAIIAWYEDVAPDSVARILADIYRSIDQLVRYPRSGMQVPQRSFRRIVTLRYHFKIAMNLMETG
jgi:plasmid stabilization system protein ParE